MLRTSGDPKYGGAAAIGWVMGYVLLALVPMGLALLPPTPAARTLWVEFGAMLGFIGMGLMCLQALFSGRFGWIAPAFGTDNVLQFHRQIGIFGVILVLMHPVVMISADRQNLSYFDPRVNFLRAVALSAVTVALIAIIVTTLWRERLKINYEWWRLIHGVIALSIVFIGVVHGWQVGHYLDPIWKKLVWVLLAGASMYLVIHTRIVRPWRARSKPYKIVDVERHRDDVTSIGLAPEGHERMDFRAGQFAWMTVGDTPFSLQQHPFSFVGSETDANIRFAAKALGDFTKTWKDFKPGMRVFLEGPLGAFTRDPHPHIGMFLIAGGIGVTPAMSILRSMRDENERQPAVLIYANGKWEEVAYQREISAMEREMNLKVVHVLSDPPDDWEGESGLIDLEMIRRHLPERPDRWEYFLCGPGPMMTIAEESLRKLGVSWTRIYSERFEIV